MNVEDLINQAIRNVYAKGLDRVYPTSLVGKKLNNIPDRSIIKYLEKELNPEFMNTEFTWAQIKKALEKNIY